MARKVAAMGVGLVMVGLALPAWAAEVVISDEARAHFSAGVNLLQDPDGARYEEAYREFKVAYATSPFARDFRAIGVDAHGNAILTFDQEGATTSAVMAARYVASTGGWSRPTPLTTDGNDYGFPTLTVSPNGTAALFYGPTDRDGPLRGPAPRGAYRLFR